MTTRRSERDRASDPDNGLRHAIAVAVKRAPEPHDWDVVEQLSVAAGGDETRSRWPVLVAAAAILVVGIAGGVFAFTRTDPQTIRSDDPMMTSTVETTAPESSGMEEQSVQVLRPVLPDTISPAWSTTIEGSFPQSAVRIGDTIAFGQQDLPGVRAVDSQSGDPLWSFTVDDPDPGTTIVGLSVIGERVMLSWMDSTGTQIVTALDIAGEALWSAEPANTTLGGVIRFRVDDVPTGFDVLAADGSVQSAIDDASMVVSTDEQLVIEREDGLVWYRLPSLERITGPIAFATQPDASVATDDHVVTIEGTQLRFFDHAGELRSELNIEPGGTLYPVDGGQPGVLVVVPDDPRPNVSGPTEGTTTFYELVDEVITPSWARNGVFSELIEVDGNQYVVHAETVEDTPGEIVQHIVDVSTGRVVVSNDSYDSPGAANGFVFTQLDHGSSDVQTVAYDTRGAEKWRLALEGFERAQIVDQGVLVASPDTVAETVDITFYE